jgi:hypothetical protein
VTHPTAKAEHDEPVLDCPIFCTRADDRNWDKRSCEGPSFSVPRSELVIDLCRFQLDRG